MPAKSSDSQWKRKPVQLAVALRGTKWDLRSDEFRVRIRALFLEMYGNNPNATPDGPLTDEELLYHPAYALNFCQVVRDRLAVPQVGDPLILRTLINARKRGERIGS